MLDQVGFEKLERLADAVDGPDARRLADILARPGKLLEDNLPERLLRRLAKALKQGLLETLESLTAPILATLCLHLLLGKADGALTMLCRLACAETMLRRCVQAVGVAERAMSAAVEVTNVVSPVLSATLTLTGSGASAAALSPAASLCVAIIERLFVGAGLPMCALAAIVVCADGLSARFRLAGLLQLIRDAAMRSARLLMALFVGLLAVEGRLAAARDTASAHAIRQALRGAIPYIGGSVSDSTGALMESVAAVRSTVGLTGMMLAVSACVGPALRLTLYRFSLRLAAAVIEPVADQGIVRVVSGFSEVAGMLVALCVGSAMLSALLAGACLGIA